MSFVLETERLGFRRLTRNDLPWLIEMRSPEPVNRYLGGTKLQNPDSITKRMEFYLECYDKGLGQCITVLKETGEWMGTSGLQPLEDTGEIEVGYNFSEKFWGRGFGTETCMAWLRHGFDDLGLERIVAVAVPQNTGSWRIMEKCGMKYEKTERHYGIDCVYYGVSKADFDRYTSTVTPR